MGGNEEAGAIGGRIHELRKARGLSQRQLAEGTSITRTYISHIESGDRLPSVRVLRELAPRLGVSVEFLETGEEKEVLVRKTATEVREYAQRCADRGDTKALLDLIDRLVKRVGSLD